MDGFLQAVIAFIVVLGPLVLIHELGHFVAARMIGVTVLEFGLGFPPRALKLFEQGGTEFTLNWIPIGGFVRPLGEDFVKPVGDKATEKDRQMYEKYQEEMAALGKKVGKTKSLMEAGPWQRMWFMSAGAIFNFVAAFIILVVSAMIGQPGPGVVVVSSIPNSPAATADLKENDVILAVNGKPITTLDEAGRVLIKKDGKAPATTLTIKRGSETFDVSIPESATACNTSNIDPDFPSAATPCGQGIYVLGTSPDSPAAAVLEEGDVIWSADGHSAATTDEFKKYVDGQAGKTVTLIVMRDLKEIKVEIVPRENPPAGQGKLGVSIMQLDYNKAFGVALLAGNVGAVVHQPIGTAISQSVDLMGTMFRSLVETPVRLLRREISADQGRLISPVGIAQISSEVLQVSADDPTPYRILQFIATISIALGFTNLLPIPGLDGGRILFVIIELVRGKPMNPEHEGLVHTIGLVLLLGLVALVVVNDIVNPIGPLLSR